MSTAATSCHNSQCMENGWKLQNSVYFFFLSCRRIQSCTNSIPKAFQQNIQQPLWDSMFLDIVINCPYTSLQKYRNGLFDNMHFLMQLKITRFFQYQSKLSYRVASGIILWHNIPTGTLQIMFLKCLTSIWEAFSSE